MGKFFESLVGAAILGTAVYLQGKDFEEKGERELKRNGIRPEEASTQEKIKAGMEKEAAERQKQIDKRVEKLQKQKEMQRKNA